MTKQTTKPNFRADKINYLIGFAGAAILTLLAYFSVKATWFTPAQTAGFVLALAVLQFFVQSYYFLHLKGEAKPRWQFWTYVYTIVTMLILVAGSIWVMYNLNYRMGMTGDQMEEYMLEQNKKGF